MITPQIVEYIKSTLEKGFPEEKIIEALTKKGWTEGDIIEATRIAKGIPRPLSPTIPPKQSTVLDQVEQKNPTTIQEKKPYKKAIIFSGGIFLLISAYVGFGATTKPILFGYDIFPFWDGKNTIPEQKTTPTPTATPEKTAPPNENQNKKAITEFFGDDADATQATSVHIHTKQKKAVFVRENGDGVWVLHFETKAVENLITTGALTLPESAKPIWAAWSTNGNKVAVIAALSDGSNNLFSTNLESRTTAQLTYGGGINKKQELRPVWNPNNDELLVYIGQDLWKISADGSKRTQVTAGLPLGEISWSPNGLKIGYTIVSQEGDRVWVMDEDGKNYKIVSPNGKNRLPAISNDGKNIWYVRRDDISNEDTLWESDINGENAKQITSISGFIESYDVNPKNNAKALIIRGHNEKRELWVSSGEETTKNLEFGEFEPKTKVFWDDDSHIFMRGTQHFILYTTL